MVSKQRHILLLLLEIYHAITLLQGPISSHFGVVTSAPLRLKRWMDDQDREQPSKKLVAVLSINLDATQY